MHLRYIEHTDVINTFIVVLLNMIKCSYYNFLPANYFLVGFYSSLVVHSTKIRPATHFHLNRIYVIYLNVT